MIRLVHMTPRLWGERGRRRAIKLGIDPARLPPGQSPTTKFPVLTVGSNPDVPLAGWALSIHGEADAPYALDWDGLMALEQVDVTCDIHCVTRWSRFDAQFEGVHWRELAKLVRPNPTARFAIAHAEAGFTSNVPLSYVEDDNALLVTHADGEPLTPDHGYPLRLVVPGKYFWKSAKWLRGIELSSVDKPGFWERYGYHNDADPWAEQRYGF
jgi:DMSO/TMAO reductase YedYZ molybdopterin-dependent catalytic subunit